MAKSLSSRAKNFDFEVYEIMKTYVSKDTYDSPSSKTESCRCSSAPISSSRLSPSHSPQRQSPNIASHPLVEIKRTKTSSPTSRSIGSGKEKKSQSAKKSNKNGTQCKDLNKYNNLASPTVPHNLNISRPNQYAQQKTNNKGMTSEKGSVISARPPKKQKKNKSAKGVTIKRLSGKSSGKISKGTKLKDTQPDLFEGVKKPQRTFKEMLVEEMAPGNFAPSCAYPEDVCRVETPHENKVEQIQSQAVKSVKKMAYDNCRLSCAVKVRDEHITSLCETSERLKHDVEEKDEFCKKLLDEHESLKYKWQDCMERNNHLLNAKDKLAKVVDQQQIRIDALIIEVDSLKRSLMPQMKHEACVGCEEESLQQHMTKHCNSINRREKELEKQIHQLRHDEIAYLEDIEKCKCKIARLKSEQNNMKCKCERKIQCLQKENANLIAANKQLIDKMKLESNDLIKKSDVMQMEFKRMSQTMNQKESTLLKERDQLKTLAKELTDITKKQNKRIDELISFNQIQENTLRAQKSDLAKQEEQLLKARAESEIIRKKYEDLEKQFETYRKQNTISCIKGNEIEKVTNELKDAKQSLKKLNETLQMKEQIIQDQVATLQQQRNGMQELRELLNKRDTDLVHLQQEMKEINNQLANEITNNTNVKRSLLEARKQNEQLSKKIEELEKLPPKQFCAGDMGRMHSLISSLEGQVAMQRREWEMEKRTISREKSRAETAAEFTTKKLLETSIDLQKNAAMHRHVQHLLISMLQDKEDQLKTVRSKISSLNLECPKAKDTLTALVDDSSAHHEVNEEFHKTVYKPPQCKIYNPRLRSEEVASCCGSSGSSVYASTASTLSQELGVCFPKDVPPNKQQPISCGPKCAPDCGSTAIIYKNQATRSCSETCYSTPRSKLSAD